MASTAVPVAANRARAGRVGSAERARRSGPLLTTRARVRYWGLLILLAVTGVALAAGVLMWDNPVPFGTDGFWRIVDLRVTSIVVIALVALSQSMATVSFQTVANNRIITPSIMGFEGLYLAIQTSAVYFFGIAGLVSLTGTTQFLVQVAAMVAMSVALYSWLLSGRHGSVHTMLLVGIVIGAGLGSVSSFMQRLLTPSEFDVLAARMLGSISNADADLLPVAVPLCLVASLALAVRARRLNVLALGREHATALGLDHRRELMYVLFWVSILIAVSTALVGPMTFLGFLIATLAYQFADTFDHRHIFPVAVLTGFVVLAGAYFVMKNIFYAQGVVGIIIQLVGGAVFLVVILRKGRL